MNVYQHIIFWLLDHVFILSLPYVQRKDLPHLISQLTTKFMLFKPLFCVRTADENLMHDINCGPWRRLRKSECDTMLQRLAIDGFAVNCFP